MGMLLYKDEEESTRKGIHPASEKALSVQNKPASSLHREASVLSRVDSIRSDIAVDDESFIFEVIYY